MKNIIKKAIKSNILFLLFAIILTVLMNLIGILFSSSMGRFIDAIKLGLNYRSIIVEFLSCVIGVIIISILTRINFDYLEVRLTDNILSRVLNHIQKLPINFFKDKNILLTTDSLKTSAMYVSGFIYGDMIKLISSIAVILVSVISIAKINLIIGMTMLIMGPITIFLIIYFNNKLNEARELDYNNTLNEAAILQDIFTNTVNIKMHSRYSILDKKLDESFKDRNKSRYNFEKINSITSNLPKAIGYVLTVTMFIVGGIGISKNQITIGQLIYMYSVGAIYLNSVYNLNEVIKSSKNVQSRIKDMAQYVDLELEPNGEYLPSDLDYIEVKNLSYKFGDKEIFKNKNIKFEKGKVYLLKGPNGSGKSTFLNVLMGLYPDYEGKIIYSNVDDNADVYGIRRKYLGIVDQQPVLLNDSLINNIKIFDDIILDQEKLYNLTEMLDITDLIKNDKSQTTFAYMDGAPPKLELSGGEKQKVSIIRALYKNPRLLILDEPTSALDKESKEKLIDFLKENKKDYITLLISHEDIDEDIIDEIIDF